MPGLRTLCLAAVGAVALAAALADHLLRRPEVTPALRGRAVAGRLGCYACHGPEGRGGVVDPGARAGNVPGWDGPTFGAYARDEGEVREWILDGAPRRRTLGATSAAESRLLPMPAYRGLLGAGELEDLVVYLRAVSGQGGEMPAPAYEGRTVAERLGCFSCHGPSGMGGSPNPASFKGEIPAWDGADFEELVRDDLELREWILDGPPARLMASSAARFFLERQTIKMPAYRRLLSDVEVDQLVAYVRWLRKP